MLIYGSGDMDLAEGPEIHMDAYIRSRRHGSCRGSMRYKWMLFYGSGDMDLAEEPEIHMDAET